VKVQKGIEAAWMPQPHRPAESDDRISRREENNIDVTKRVKFANKTTAMFNAAGKIKSGVNDYETTTRRRSDEKRLEERGGVYTRANSRGGESVKPVARSKRQACSQVRKGQTHSEVGSVKPVAAREAQRL